MAFNYPGNPAGAAGTIPAPARRVIPTGTGIPSDGDAANAASVNPPGFETAMDWLAFLNVQGALGDALGGAATSFDGSSNPTTWNDMLTADGAPISGLDVMPTFASASAFSVTIGAGSGYLNTSVGIGAGESTYRTILWGSQGATHTTPHATLDRIDAITVTPAAFGTASVLAVVTGTPAATPLAPANPSGSGVLFYVLIPAAAADSTHFRACRGLWRRVGYPWSGMSAIISGAELSWDYTADPSTTSADIYFGAPDLTGTISVNRLLIDGELIEWVGAGEALNGNTIVPDSTANPFGTTASSSFDTPYYIYAVGGRHNPMPSSPTSSDLLLNPVTIVESLIAPNPRTGKPTGNLTVNGVTVTPNGAVYIGIGFVVQGTTRRRACVMDAEMTYGLNPVQLIVHTFTTSGYENMGDFSGGAMPEISTKMRVNLLFENGTGAPGALFMKLQDFPLGGIIYGPVSMYTGGGAGQNNLASINGLDMSFTPRTGSILWANGGSASILTVAAMGFNHRVNRITVGY